MSSLRRHSTHQHGNRLGYFVDERGELALEEVHDDGPVRRAVGAGGRVERVAERELALPQVVLELAAYRAQSGQAARTVDAIHFGRSV